MSSFYPPFFGEPQPVAADTGVGMVVYAPNGAYWIEIQSSPDGSTWTTKGTVQAWAQAAGIPWFDHLALDAVPRYYRARQQ